MFTRESLRESLNASTVGIGVALGVLGIAYLCLGKRSEHIPPGPPCYPLIGNLLNFPIRGWADIFPKWHRKYGVYHASQQMSLSLSEPILDAGNLVYANLMGMPIFVIGDREVAEELLNVRGGISAGRPPNVLVQELCVAFPTRKRRAIDKSYLGWASLSGMLHLCNRERSSQSGVCIRGKLQLVMLLAHIDHWSKRVIVYS
jgi:hypothetical protein